MAMIGMPQGGAPKSTAAFPIWSITGGVVANMPAISIPDNAAADSDNVVYYDGRVRPRPGLSTPPGSINPNNFGATDPNSIVHMNLLQSTLSAPNSTYLFVGNVDYTTGMMAFNYYQPALGAYETIAKAGGGYEFPVNATQSPSSAQFVEDLFVCPTTAGLQLWQPGASAFIDVAAAQSNAALKSPDQPYFIMSTASRVFLGNAIDLDSGQRNPYRVWWCDSFNPNVWNANGSGQPAQGSSGFQDLSSDSSPITGMVFRGSTQPIVFKAQSIHIGQYVGGPQWYNFIPITHSRGLPAGASGSIQQYNDVVIWLGADNNVYTMDTGFNINAVGDAIRPILQQYYNPAYASQISSLVDLTLGLYWLSIPIGLNQGVPYNINKWFVLNLHTGAWGVQTIQDSSFYLASAFYLPVTPSFLYASAPQLNTPDPFSSTALQLWGTSTGQILAIDWTKPAMVDGPNGVPFSAYWWGKTRDFLSASQLGYPGKVPMSAKGEVCEWTKVALHGTYGQARPCIRMGKTFADVELNRHFQFFDQVNIGPQDLPQAFAANVRTIAERFGQFGIMWEKGQQTPAAIDGLTVWGSPQNQEAR